MPDEKTPTPKTPKPAKTADKTRNNFKIVLDSVRMYVAMKIEVLSEIGIEGNPVAAGRIDELKAVLARLESK